MSTTYRKMTSGGETPTGSVTITENGTYDVTNKASAVVNVQGGSSSDSGNVTLGLYGILNAVDTISVTMTVAE